jgi:hypothetical protein
MALVEGTLTGFVVSETTVEPATVTVLGPERRIKSTNAATDRVSIEGVGDSDRHVKVGVGTRHCAFASRPPGASL